MITNKHYKIITVSYEDSGYLYFENISNQTGWLYPRLVRDQNAANKPNCEYSLNGVDWHTLDFNVWPYHVSYVQWGNSVLPGVMVPPHARIYLRGVNQQWSTNSYGGPGFLMSVPYILGGNLLSLIDYNNMDSITTIPYMKAETTGPFANDNNLISAEKMNFGNATTAANGSLYGMFSGCKSLVKGPDMSKITTIDNDGCNRMFNGCTSLTTVPDLSSVTTVGNRGMNSMFNSCTAITTGPDMSGITTVNQDSMNLMFYKCTSLTTAPDLSNVVTIGSQGMKQMFENCSALTTAPDLSSVTTVGNNGMRAMFNGCTVLANVPDLSNITTITDTDNFGEMFQNCKAITTGPDMSGLTTLNRYSLSNAFKGCTSLVTPPDLSGLTRIQGDGSLRETFSGCSSLTKGVDLRNVTYSDWGWTYLSTYDGCYKLEEVTYPNVSTWGEGIGMANAGRDVAGTKTFYAPTGLVIPDGGIPTGWTRVDY